MALAVFTGALIVAGFVIAQRQYFFGDDFAFLDLVQRHGVWRDVFLPSRPALEEFWTYRPLTTDVFFSLGFHLFGYEPFGYLAISLGAHFLALTVVYRLARQFSFEPRLAIVAALLSVSRYPSLTQVFWISAVQYTVTMLLFLICVSLYFDYAQSGRGLCLLGCCVALLLALLSNEVSTTLPGVLFLVSLYVDRFRLNAASVLRSLRRTLGPLAIVCAYLIFRTQFIATGARNASYFVAIGWNVVANYRQDLVYVFDGEIAELAAATLLCLAILGLAICSQRVDRRTLTWLTKTNLLCFGWLSVVLVPYVVLPYPYPRLAIPAEVPACLLFASYLNVLSRLVPDRLTRPFEMGLLALLVVSIPYATLREHLERPAGRAAKQFLELVQSSNGELRDGTAVVVLVHGSDGLVNSSRAEDFGARLFGGAALRAFFPGKNLGLFILDATKPPRKDLRCAPCLVLNLVPGQTGEISDYRLVPLARETGRRSTHSTTFP